MDTSELRELADDCVHCGFCLPACPTYQLWGEEMDSPRGRIHLMTQVLDGAELSDATATHIDRCLGCMACVTACPSGVRYDRLIESARAWVEDSDLRPQVRDGGTTASGGHAGEGVGMVGTRPERDALPEGGIGSPRTGSPRGGTGRTAFRRPVADRAARSAIFAVFPYPNRLRLLAGPLRLAQRTGLDKLAARTGLAARISPVLDASMRIAPAQSGPRLTGRLPERVAARGRRRAVVGMLTGCVQSVFFPQVNAATARVLASEGCDVVIPRGQGCCGALSLHSGRTAEAVRFARATIEAFERAGVEAIVVNSAGCGSAMKDYADVLADDPQWADRAKALSAKTRDLCEFLTELFDRAGGPVAPRHPLPVTVAYHDACHLGHAQRITAPPRALLRVIPQLALSELSDAGTCCGSAGVYNLLQPEAASELGARKADGVTRTGAELLVSANPGCSLQISSALADRGERIAVAHTAEVLDASIRGLPAGALTDR